MNPRPIIGRTDSYRNTCLKTLAFTEGIRLCYHRSVRASFVIDYRRNIFRNIRLPFANYHFRLFRNRFYVGPKACWSFLKFAFCRSDATPVLNVIVSQNSVNYRCWLRGRTSGRRMTAVRRTRAQSKLAKSCVYRLTNKYITLFILEGG